MFLTACFQPALRRGRSFVRLEQTSGGYMKVFAGAFLAATIAAALNAQMTPPKTNLKIGDTAPDFTLTATTGQKVTLSEFRGKKNVVLAFFPAAFTGG
jgi:acyl-CoA synthetase (AMP-forming)/AMP-acid ligase II